MFWMRPQYDERTYAFVVLQVLYNKLRIVGSLYILVDLCYIPVAVRLYVLFYTIKSITLYAVDILTKYIFELLRLPFKWHPVIDYICSK